jgi:arylformamidase
MILDVTLRLRPGMPTYPGEEGPRLDFVKSRARGDPADVRRLTLALHTGTHVDAPGHFIDGGATVEALPLEVLAGPCQVVSIDGDPDVSAAALAARFPAGRPVPERLLLRTRNSAAAPPLLLRDAFTRDFAAIAHDAARWLVDRGVRLVGIDYLSIEPFAAQEPRTHRILLEAGVVAVEGLELSRAAPGTYQLWCLPALLEGADGAPARVLLERR